jgi:ferric-dicitrate binding protein FerR (iron transport regulator)
MMGEMNVNEPNDPATGEADADLGGLLRAAGPRARPSPEVEAQIRAAVEAEWRAMTESRARRRRVSTWAMAAGVAVAAVGVWIARPLYMPGSGPVASMARVEGTVEFRSGGSRDWAPLAVNAQLHDGDELRTGSAGRAAVKLASGVALRLDNTTRVALNDLHHARLRRGGVYVDSGVTGADPSRELELDTPVGAVRHLGTQYQARVSDGSLEVGVREGLVAIDAHGQQTVGRAGEMLTLKGGLTTRNALAANADAWGWASAIAPPFEIEGRSVDEFLAWAGRETGRQVVYSSAEAAQRARAIVLKGSTQGLTPDDAVSAVLATTPLHPAIDDGHIRVEATSP